MADKAKKCRYCGLIHKSNGDECHPDINHIMSMLYDAEDKVENLTKEINKLNSIIQELRLKGDNYGSTNKNC